MSEILVPRLDVAQEVKAPGHVPAVLTPEMDELVLVPDALLVIQAGSYDNGPRITSHDVRTISVEGDSAWFSLSVTDQRLAVAACPDLVDSGTGKTPDVRLSLQLASGWVLEVLWQPVSGRLDEWTIPDIFAGSLATASLLVEARTAKQPVGHGPGYRWELFSPRPPGSTQNLVDATLTWGRVAAIQRAALGEPRSVETAIAECVFDEVVVGRTYVVTCIARDRSLLGRVEFVFEGQFKDIELLQNSFVALQLVDNTNRFPIADAGVRIDLFFGDRECRDGLCVWNGQLEEATDGQGRLQVCLNPKVAIQVGIAFPPPDAARVKITVDGFHPYNLDVVKNGATGLLVIETIQMLRRQPLLVLSEFENMDDSFSLMIVGDDVSFELDVESRVFDFEGQAAVGVYAGEDTDEEEVHRRLDDMDAQVNEVLLATIDGQLLGVVRNGSVWSAMGSCQWELELMDGRPSSAPGRVEIGIRWRGIDHHLGWMFPEVGAQWSFQAPATDLSLWSRTVVDGDHPTQKTEYPIVQHAQVTVR